MTEGGAEFVPNSVFLMLDACDILPFSSLAILCL